MNWDCHYVIFVSLIPRCPIKYKPHLHHENKVRTYSIKPSTNPQTLPWYDINPNSNLTSTFTTQAILFCIENIKVVVQHNEALIFSPYQPEVQEFVPALQVLPRTLTLSPHPFNPPCKHLLITHSPNTHTLSLRSNKSLKWLPTTERLDPPAHGSNTLLSRWV